MLFPIKARASKIAYNKRTELNMWWHESSRIKDGILRHPADSKAQETFYAFHVSFFANPQKVRLALPTEGTKCDVSSINWQYLIFVNSDILKMLNMQSILGGPSIDQRIQVKLEEGRYVLPSSHKRHVL